MFRSIRQAFVQPSWSFAALFSSAVLLFLAVFAWRFADERLYADSGYYLARVINEGSFRVEHGRWVLALSQVLPLIGVKLGLPLTVLIKLHSLNNVAWLAGCLLAAWKLGDRTAMVALAAVHLVGLTHGLFCPIFELYYGVDLLILFQAVLANDRLRPRLRWPLLIALFLVVLSSHMFAMLLMAGWLVLHRVWRDRRLTITLASLFVVNGLLRAFTISDYEKDHLSFVHRFTDPEALWRIVSPHRLFDLLAYTLRHYPDVLLLALASTFFLIMRRQRLTLFVFVGMLAVFHVLIAMKIPDLVHDRYREQVNFVVTSWAVLVFCFHALYSKDREPLLTLLLVGSIVFRVAQAEWIASYYEMRTGLTESRITVARQHGLHKAIVSSPVYFGPEHDAIDLSWSTSVESLLLSAKAGPGSTVSLITREDAEVPEVAAGLDRFVFRRWDVFDPEWLDERYFNMPAGTYEPLPNDPGP